MNGMHSEIKLTSPFERKWCDYIFSLLWGLSVKEVHWCLFSAVFLQHPTVSDITILTAVWRVMKVMRPEMSPVWEQIAHSPSTCIVFRWHTGMSQLIHLLLDLTNCLALHISFSVHVCDIMDFTFTLPNISLYILLKH